MRFVMKERHVLTVGGGLHRRPPYFLSAEIHFMMKEVSIPLLDPM